MEPPGPTAEAPEVILRGALAEKLHRAVEVWNHAGQEFPDTPESFLNTLLDAKFRIWSDLGIMKGSV